MQKTSKIIITALIIFSGFSLKAQLSNLITFTQEREPFTIIINGVQQNPQAETNVKITGLTAPNYKVKILFQNQAIPEINKTIYLQQETESSYEILKNSKGIWVMRMLNSVPMDEATPVAQGQDIYDYTTTPRLGTATVSQTKTVSAGGVIPGGVSITTTTTQTNANTSTNTTIHEQGEEHAMGDDDRDEYSGPRGCPRPMGSQSFSEALESISSKTFASSKLTIAKQIVGANCLKCRQVKEIMKLFTFESDRLEFAKFAYKYTWDVRNYFMLNDAFEFESSVDELNTYINRRK